MDASGQLFVLYFMLNIHWAIIMKFFVPITAFANAQEPETTCEHKMRVERSQTPGNRKNHERAQWQPAASTGSR